MDIDCLFDDTVADRVYAYRIMLWLILSRRQTAKIPRFHWQGLQIGKKFPDERGILLY